MTNERISSNCPRSPGDSDDAALPAPSATPLAHSEHAHILAAFSRRQYISSVAAADFEPPPGDTIFRALRDAGIWAFGIVAVECWTMNDEMQRLERPQGGIWVDPAFLATELPRNDALCQLMDETQKGYLPPPSLTPGAGLPGVLWAETFEHAASSLERFGRSYGQYRSQELDWPDEEKGSGKRQTWAHSGSSISHGWSLFQSSTQKKSVMASVNTRRRRGISLGSSERRRVVWREIEPLALDPDQPYSPHLILLASSGLGLASGIRFSMPGRYRGVVIYYARSSVDLTKLRSATNDEYLRRAADAVGAAAAMEASRRVCVEMRKEERGEVWKKAKMTIRALGASVVGLESRQGKASVSGSGNPEERIGSSGEKRKKAFIDLVHLEDADMESFREGCHEFSTGRIKAAKAYFRKCCGGHNQPPPPFSNREAIFTFFGSFLTLMALAAINGVFLSKGWGARIIMGPFGAFMTLLYGLTAAPASQPRNALLGQVFSISVAMLVSRTRIPDRTKEALATSLAIAVMARVGITHPPAGATAFTFSTGTYEWAHMGLMLLGYVLAVVLAVLFNNLDSRRQYPTFWVAGGFEQMQKLKRKKSK